jgi:hypothetical protein
LIAGYFYEQGGQMGNRQKVLYSRLELLILENIPTDGAKITTNDLVRVCYEANDIPVSARQSIIGGVNKINQKLKINEENWEILRNEARGPRPISFWRVKRNVK